ncbi:thiamine phosphate synthase [Micromonospora sp. NPDC049891]|uniref:thiamine phosphate synthase n=1 Tax=Micromonospora sp. NPDC049891 TaxID=3155655 RepID=UPI0033FEC67C
MPSGVVLLTDRRVARGALVEVVAAAVAGGVRWVVLREKDLPRVERLALATELRSILAEAGGTLVIAGPDPLIDHGDPGRAALGATADGSGADLTGAGAGIRPGSTGTGRSPVALHLSAAGPYPPPVADLVGRSCHDASELRRLTTEDYVTLSPVFPTRTKPGYGPPLRPGGLTELIRLSPVPVLALGGIETPAQARACAVAGATGVAVLGAIMRADDPTAAASTLTRAFGQATQPEATTPKPAGRQVPVGTTATGPSPAGRHVPTGRTTTGLRPTVPTQGSSLTARSGHGRPQPPTATTEPRTNQEEVP